MAGNEDIRRISIKLKPLSINQAFQGRRFKSKGHRQYEKDIHALVKPCLNPLTGMIVATYSFFIKNDKMTDGDNLVKVLQDILVKLGYIKDDRYIKRYIIEKYHSENEHIEVEFREIK